MHDLWETIVLTNTEIFTAAIIGIRRHIASILRKDKDANGFDGEQKDGWGIHIEGAAGELATAKILDVYWPAGVNTFKDPDLGSDIQVRTRSNHSWDLIVRRDDNDKHYFVLVTGKCPELRVHGALLGAEAKKEKWLATYGKRPAAFFVPKSDLVPIRVWKETYMKTRLETKRETVH